MICKVIFNVLTFSTRLTMLINSRSVSKATSVHFLYTHDFVMDLLRKMIFFFFFFSFRYIISECICHMTVLAEETKGFPGSWSARRRGKSELDFRDHLWKRRGMCVVSTCSSRWIFSHLTQMIIQWWQHFWCMIHEYDHMIMT